MSSAVAAEKQFAAAVERQLAGDLVGAERGYRRVLQRFPGNVPTLLNLGIVLLAKGAAAQAVAAFRRAVKAMPEHADAHSSLGVALERLGKVREAEAAYREALALDPRHADANNNLGNLLRARGGYLEAVRHYRAALEADPSHMRALDNLGDALQADGRIDEAVRFYDRAEARRPSFGRRIKRGLALPPVYENEAALGVARDGFMAALAALEAQPESIPDPLAELNQLPFYLAYQGHDDRDALERFAGLLRPSLPAFVEPRSKAPGKGRRRVGLVSAYWNAHSVANCYLGHLPVLRDAGFDLLALDLGPNGGAAPVAGGIAAHRPLPHDLSVARQVIADLHLDALVYFELGMDPLSYFLASSRLAPVQMALSGHPVTSGLRTVDYYLSDRWTEADDADRSFTERLVRLPWFPSVWQRPAAPSGDAGRAALGLPETGALYVCPMMLFKLHPEFDRCLAGILHGDRDGHVILFEDRYSPRLGEVMRRRFAESLGVLATRVRFLPFMPLDSFAAVLRHATVVLDTYPFGGGTTLLNALNVGVPYVTRPSGLTRGRVGAALYNAIGVEGPVAASDGDYAKHALGLAADHAERDRLAGEIAGRAGMLFDNLSSARELAAVIDAAIAGRAVPGT